MKEKFKEGDVVESGGTIVTVTNNNAGHYIGCFKGVVIHDEEKRDDRKIGMISDMWITDSFTKIEPQHSFDQYFKEKEAKTQKTKSMFREGDIVYNPNSTTKAVIFVTEDQSPESIHFSGTVLTKGFGGKHKNNFWNSKSFELLPIDLEKTITEIIIKKGLNKQFKIGDVVVNDRESIHVLVTESEQNKDSFAGTVIKELKKDNGYKVGTYSEDWITTSFTKVEDEIQIKP